MGAPKVKVMRSSASVSRKALGAYSRSSTTVPPISSVPSSQLLSGDECHTGIATSVRSLRDSDMPAAVHTAAMKTLRWLCRQPLGLPVVPEV
ncbi:hypothetical protein D3C71_467470 [compost metagenome]